MSEPEQRRRSMRTSYAVAALVTVAITAACTSSEDRIAQHRARAERYVASEQWKEAKIEFLNLVQLAPMDAVARYEMARVLFRLQEYSEGLQQLDQAVVLAPENVDWRLELVQLLAASRSYELARVHVDIVLRSEPQNVVALLLRAGLSSLRNDLNRMLTDVEAALEIEPRNLVALRMRARVLVRRDELAGAEQAWRSLVEVAQTTRHYLELSRFLSGLERNDEALGAARRAIEVAEDDSERVAAQLNLATLHVSAGSIAAGRETLEVARQQSPSSGDIALGLARLYLATGAPERAEALLLENVEREPDSPEPLLVLADYYRSREQPDRAIESIDRALVVAPDSEPALLGRADYLHSREQDESTRAEAWQLVESILAKHPDSVLAHFTEGKFHLSEGRHEAAATSLRRVVDQQPSANAHVLLGRAYRGMDQPTLARREFQQALHIDPQSTPARLALGALYLQDGEVALAEEEARRLVAARPADVAGRMLLVSALLRQEQRRHALEVLEPIGAAIELSPSARLDVARLRRQAGDPSGARLMLHELVEVGELRSRAQAELIECDLQEGHTEQAIRRLDAWISGNDPELYLLRARVRLVRGEESQERTRARADLEEAIQKGLPGVQAHLLLARLQLRDVGVAASLQTLLDAREVAPAEARVPFELAMLHQREGRLDEAREAYEAVLQLDQDQPVAQNNLAWLLASAANATEEDLDRALQLAQAAQRALPDNPSVVDTLGWVMVKKNRTSAAIPLFHEAIRAVPEAHPLRGTARYHLAQAYEREGQPDRAIAELVRALDEVPRFAEREAAEEMLRQLRKS